MQRLQKFDICYYVYIDLNHLLFDNQSENSSYYVVNAF